MDQASQVREKIDIVGLITEYIPLKKMGRNFTTTCPFHNENSPSFVVSPERQIWHCFGCAKGGDVFSFLMEYENLEFIEALRMLAKKAGVELKMIGNPANASKRENIFSINKLAADYYHFVLTKHKAGERALEYLIENRGLNEKLINTFKIGFSPSGGEDLSKFLINKKNFKDMDLIEAGLSFKKGNRIVDFFRGRIMFPLIDHRDNIIAFSGRNILDSDLGPKYINTKETLVYHKGSTFFGFNLAKESIKKENFTIVMEGEFDVISAYKEGISNVVALKGTALTMDQALLLSRFAPRVALCLDQDSAGIEAVRRSIPNLEKRGLIISMIVTSEKDPDEALKKNPIEFKKNIKESVEVYDYLLNKYLNENDSSSSSGKKNISDQILPLISEIQNEIVKEHYIKKLSEAINTSSESLLRQIDKKENKKEEDKVFQKIQKVNRRELLEEYLLGLILQSTSPKHMLVKSKDVLIEYNFMIPSIGKIFSDLIVGMINNNFDLKKISENLSKELIPIYDKSYLMPLPKFENDQKYQEEVIRSAKELKIFSLKGKLREISKKLKNTDEDGEDILKIKEEISNITSQIIS